MNIMALSTEILITLQQLKGVGKHTILSIARSISATSMDELWENWETLKAPRLKKITRDDLMYANQKALQIINTSEELGIGIISYFDDAFPQLLKDCVNEKGKVDPSLVLYYRGDLKVLSMPGVAVIGTREPTSTGVNAGKYFSGKLAERGFNIVSGLAVGCDTSGHEGALDAGGVTTAFLATSLAWDDIYPQENLELAKKIVENGGLLLSEYAIGQHAGRYNFVERDRLQAGLSYATVVVQTGIHGGTMHAVNATLQAHKPLYVVKFKRDEDLDNPKTQGNSKLLKGGKAMPLCSSNVDKTIHRIKEVAASYQPLQKELSLFATV
jgi:DNA processing protein